MNKSSSATRSYHTTDTALDVRQITPAIGAEIHGVRSPAICRAGPPRKPRLVCLQCCRIVTRLENIGRWRWSAGDVVIWDNRAAQHKAIDDYGNEPRIVRRVTIDGPLSVGIDGRHGKTRNSDGPIRLRQRQREGTQWGSPD